MDNSAFKLLMNRGGGAAFDPLTLNPSVLYDASLLTGGGNISQLSDLSPNAKHATQGTGSLQPTAQGYADFDGVDDLLVGPVITDYIAAAEFDIIISGRFDASSTDSVNFYENPNICADSGGYIGIGCRSSGFISAGIFDGAPKSVQDTYTLNTNFVAHFRLVGGLMSLTINARAPVTLAASSVQVVTGLMRLGVGFSFYMNGRLYRAFFRKTVLTAPQLALVKTWAGAPAGVIL